MSTEPPVWNPEPAGITPGPSAPEPGTPAPAVARPIPVATLAIAAICVAVFVLQTRAGGSKNPYVLLDFGVSHRSYFVHGQYWRAVMPLFLHIGWWHLAMNMVPFLLLGPVLEEMYGYGRYACVYLGAGIIGVLTSMFIGHHESAGASGAIMGVIAAIPTAGHFHRDALPYHLARVFRRGRLTVLLVVFMVMEIVSGFTVSNVDNWGHLGGLLGGALLALLIPTPKVPEGRGAGEAGVGWDREPRSVNAWSNQAVVLIPVAVVALGMFGAARHYRVAHQVSQMLDQAERLRVNRQPGQA
ncbi:MAG TPA: rhomboid family intramembrane serine protease, partial [Terriglobia bacterium]|nr:rhomboid family intramembrane serine protease [Terriglobia bacterium]